MLAAGRRRAASRQARQVTSNACLGVVKRLFNAASASHTGTLDPFATGLLPVALGNH